MTSHTASCYPVAVQSVFDAIDKDDRGEAKEAYCDYLNCMMFIVKALRDDAIEHDDTSELCFESTSKLFKLTEQCLERARDILATKRETRASSPNADVSCGGVQSSGTLSSDGSKRTLQTPRFPRRPLSTSSLSSPVFPNRNRRRVSEPPTNKLPQTSQDLISRLPSPPGVRKTSPTSPNPEMYSALQRRKTISGTKNVSQKSAATSYNLSLFRQAAEKRALNLAKEKVMQQHWLERQQEIKLDAEKRWDLRKNRSQRDKEYRKNLLEEILAYEEAAQWPAEYRAKVKAHQTDVMVITSVVQMVLKCRDHPLCKVCKGLQYLIYQKVYEVLHQAEDTPNYLESLDTLPKNSVNQNNNKHQVTGNATTAVIEDERKISDDVTENTEKGGGSIFRSDELRKTLSSPPLSKTGDYRPVPAPRKSFSSGTPQQKTKRNSEPEKSLKSEDFDEDDLELPDVPKVVGIDSIDGGSGGLTPFGNTSLSNSTLQKVDSFEKVYDELGDVMFSSDSEDADDEAGKDEDNAESSVCKGAKDETDYGESISKEAVNNGEFKPLDDGELVPKETLHDGEKRNNGYENSNCGENSTRRQSADDTLKKGGDADNPLYFALNNNKGGDTLQNDTRSNLKNDDIIPLTDHGGVRSKEKKDEPNNSTYEIPPNAPPSYEISPLPCAPPTNEILPPVASPTTETTEIAVKPGVSISVYSPTSPGIHLYDDGSPLPSHFVNDGEIYSDLSDEFEGEKYEELVPSPTEKESKPILRRNGRKQVPSPHRKSTELQPEYFQVEIVDNPELNKAKTFSAIEEAVYEALDTVEENIYEDLDALTKTGDSSSTGADSGCTFKSNINDEDLAFVIDTFFLKRLDSIVQELRFGIDRLHTVLLLAYEDLDNPNGRDPAYSALECVLFQPLWPWIFQMFKKMNMHKVEYMERVMDHYGACVPQTLKIRDKFALLDPDNHVDDYRPYQEAIDELRKIEHMISPIDKIDCAVRMSKSIHTCVEKYWCGLKGMAKTPTLGCDDLLPIVAFVVLKTNYPQIVSECHAMEEFIRDDYMMGEEGYCLTTLHAAISYLLSLSKDLHHE